ncbi:MAG: hypothetical protein K9J13_04070 [Saprospiraceae bacterium]|nr:hypothetical protein [Saprospiraceae bacterium]
MKNKILLTFLLCSSLSSILYAQINPNFYTIKSNLDSYFDSIIQIKGIDSMQGTGYNPYKRWVNYWEPILYPSGDFATERQRLELYITDFKNNTAPQSIAPFTLDWELIGPNKMPTGSQTQAKGLGQIHYLAFDPNDNTNQKMFACSPAGGLWRSLNGGETWFNAGTDKGLPLCGVSSIAIDPDNSNTNWFVSTGNGEPYPDRFWAQNSVGVGRTTDGGTNWQIIGLDNVLQMRKIILKRYQGQIHLFATTTDGIYECEDGLSTNPQWNKLISGNFYDIEFDPQNTGIAYASGTGANTSVYKIDWINDVYSVLPNLSSIPVENGMRLIIEISNAAPNSLFIVATYYGGLNTSYLYRYNLSTNNIFYKGELPNAIIDPQGVGPERAMGWTISPVLNSNNELSMVYGNTAPIRLTNNLLDNNNYCTWTDITSTIPTYNYPYYTCKIHVDMHYMIYEPDGQTLWVANDGGVYKSTLPDLINNWEEKNNGLAVATIHRLAVNEKSKDIALSGAYDCGSNLYKKTNNLWTEKQVVGGDGFQCQFDWNNQNTMWASLQHKVYRSDDGGQYFFPKDGDLHWESFFIQNNVYPYILYGTNEDGIRRSTDYGDNWSDFANYPGVNNNKTWTVTNSRTHGNYIYTSWYGNSSPNHQKVFKSITGGGLNTSYWEDVGSPIVNKWIGSIVIDYFDPDHIWVSAGEKIYSVNTITHQWTDISNGLPSYVNVENLELLSTDEGILFAGTNYGLYYYREQNGIWQYVNGDLPNVNIRDIQIDEANSRIVVATFGRGVWEANLPCFDESNAVTTLINNQSGDVTINSNIKFSGNIDIYDNKTLTINNGAIVSMGANHKIIVQPGSRLIIDNATITSGCGSYWTGIEVWGDKDEPQTYAYDGTKWMPEFQGEVIIRNGGTIRNSVDGIMAIGKDYITGEFKWETTGGIIKATDANFINNNNSIWVGGYRSGNTHNRSKIINCNFETNDLMLPGHTGYSFIGLCGINNINITGNRFKNTTQNSIDDRGIGIVSYDASINVRSLCTSLTIPCSSYKPNTFTGLNYGIKIFNSDPNVTTSIVDNDFINCYRGIYLENTSTAVVTNNDFEVPTYASSNLPYGMHIFGGTGFKVEENNFTNYGDFAGTRGIVISNTLATVNQIYKNTFSGLNIGIQPQFINKGQINGDDVGLCLFCNVFDNPMYDVWVAGKDDSPSGTPNIGIAEFQQNSIGASKLPAGNEFTFTHNQFDYDFSNDDAEFLKYYHEDDTPTEKYEPTNYSNLQPDNADWGTVQRCQSKIGNGNNNTQNYSNLYTARIAYNSSSLIRDIWKDGGLEDLGEEIETTDPWDAYVQFNELMSLSPYLSDEALIAMIENPVFTSLMVKLVMIANPQASHNDEIMQAIYDRLPEMPQSYIDAILAGSDGYSPLEQLEANVSSDYHLIRNIGEDIKRVYRMDTLNNWAEDSIIAFISRQKGLRDKYELAATYLHFGQYENMNTVLTNIPNLFDLDELQLLNYQNNLITFAIAADIKENNKVPGSLNETQLTNLDNIMQTEELVDKSMTLALLKWNNPEYEYNEIILEPSESSARMAKPNKIRKDIDEDETLFKIFPNPANNYITVQYRTSDKFCNKLSIAIKDASGRIIIEKQLIGGDNEELIDTQKLKNGYYTILLYCDNNVISVEKLTITK